MRIVLALVFLVLPLAEIAVFIAVGSQIGIGWTLALILATTILGVATVRRQSLANLRSAQAQARTGALPGREIVHGALIAFAGLLLILPGFITDTLGLLLLVPPLREAAWRQLRGRVEVRTHRVYAPGYGPGYGQGARPLRPDVLDLSDGEFERHEETGERRADPASPWREVGGREVGGREIEGRESEKGPGGPGTDPRRP